MIKSNVKNFDIDTLNKKSKYIDIKLDRIFLKDAYTKKHINAIPHYIEYLKGFSKIKKHKTFNLNHDDDLIVMYDSDGNITYEGTYDYSPYHDLERNNKAFPSNHRWGHFNKVKQLKIIYEFDPASDQNYKIKGYVGIKK